MVEQRREDLVGELVEVSIELAQRRDAQASRRELDLELLLLLLIVVVDVLVLIAVLRPRRGVRGAVGAFVVLLDHHHDTKVLDAALELALGRALQQIEQRARSRQPIPLKVVVLVGLLGREAQRMHDRARERAIERPQRTPANDLEHDLLRRVRHQLGLSLR